MRLPVLGLALAVLGPLPPAFGGRCLYVGRLRRGHSDVLRAAIDDLFLG